jgi:hypothetical protein
LAVASGLRLDVLRAVFAHLSSRRTGRPSATPGGWGDGARGYRVSRGRFIRQYAGYLVARSVPASLAVDDRLLRHRFRYRTFAIDPAAVTAKPGFPDDARPDREHEIELLAAMTRRFLVDGGWDLRPRPFDLHPAVEDLFVHGLPPERTRTYARMLEAVEAGDHVAARGCRDVHEVEAWFANLRRIHDGIAEHGYRSQLRLGRPPGDEITLCVGRGGRLFLLRHGNHRLSIAKVLGLRRVPAIVRGVHSGFLDGRGVAGRRGTVPALERELRALMQQSAR